MRGPATLLEAPEGDSRLALIDVRAPTADSAVALAWAAYLPNHEWPLKVTTTEPDKEGWSDRHSYTYQTSPNEKRTVAAFTQRAGDTWSVAIYDMSDATGEKRGAAMEANYSVISVRPAGAAWSSVHDMLQYVAMELAEGKLPDGTPYIGREALLARRARQVDVGKEATYGMGLMVDTKYGTPVVHHGGDMIGFHSDMMWLPEHGVGAVVLTNGDPGWVLRDLFQRKLLEVLFAGRAEADADVAAQAKSYYAHIAADRKLLVVPADRAESSKLAGRFHNDALGDITVRRDGGRTVFDFGEFQSEVASRKNPDGSISFLTIALGIEGFEFVVSDGARQLTIRDAQHEYVFTGRDGSGA